MTLLEDLAKLLNPPGQQAPETNSKSHSRIKSDQLRLLKPVSRNPGSLYFSVSTVRRSQAPPYTAVSYVWGDSAATEVIYLNEEPFPVKPNLWSCLYNLVRSGKSYLWVDAICINQTDNVEKGAQVRCMDKTYKNAASVAVWLGLTSSHPRSLSQRATGSFMTTLGEDVLAGRELIDELVSRPYWSRVWVIQEFLLCNKVEVWYDTTRINALEFQDMILEYSGVKLHEIKGMDYTTANGPHRAWSLIMGRDPDRHPDFGRPLWRLLIEHRHAMCKDPRDKVFGLLGLVGEEERGLLGRFFPDYDMSEDQVIVLTLVHLYEYSRAVDECPRITPDSDDIFLGLGVTNKLQRKEFLRRALHAEFDYFGDWVGNPLDTGHQSFW